MIKCIHESKNLLFNMAKSYERGNTTASYTVADKNGQDLLVEEEVAGRWMENFEKLLNGNIEQKERSNDQEGHRGEEVITVEVMKQTMILMKMAKLLMRTDNRKMH